MPMHWLVGPYADSGMNSTVSGRRSDSVDWSVIAWFFRVAGVGQRVAGGDAGVVEDQLGGASWSMLGWPAMMR